MAAQRLRVKPALEAHDIILLHGSRIGTAGGGGLLHRWGTPETGQCPMHLDNQCCELVGRDLVMLHIASDDLRD
jgi:hypothetical protein